MLDGPATSERHSHSRNIRKDASKDAIGRSHPSRRRPNHCHPSRRPSLHRRSRLPSKLSQLNRQLR
jgi:hypothetical protein